MASELLGPAPPQRETTARSKVEPTEAALAMRIWGWIPDSLFRVVGSVFFFGYLFVRIPDYFQGFWNLGPYYVFQDGYRLSFPWTRILIDLTCLLIALSYLFRVPARKRTDRESDILIALLGGFWPMLPFLFAGCVSLLDPGLSPSLAVYLWKPSLSLVEALTGAALILLGNALDVWGYSTLFTSFSIVPEARELKSTGIYRIMRHPIYFGQMLAQTGVWLFFAKTSLFSIGFLLAFIALQLYRSKLEDRVLENAFGDRYRAWKSQTFWFV